MGDVHLVKRDPKQARRQPAHQLVSDEGVNGPYAVLLGGEADTAMAETSDQGYPVLERVKRLVDDKIIWVPAIDGALW